MYKCKWKTTKNKSALNFDIGCYVFQPNHGCTGSVDCTFKESIVKVRKWSRLKMIFIHNVNVFPTIAQRGSENVFHYFTLFPYFAENPLSQVFFSHTVFSIIRTSVWQAEAEIVKFFRYEVENVRQIRIHFFSILRWISAKHIQIVFVHISCHFQEFRFI